MPSLAHTLIEEVRTKYGGTHEEATYDEVAKNVAGVAYAGEVAHSCVMYLHSSLCRWCRYSTLFFLLGLPGL